MDDKNEEIIVQTQSEDITIQDGKETTAIKLDAKNRQLLSAAKSILKKKSIMVTQKRQDSEDNELINESDLKDILNQEDYIYYKAKKEIYLESYPDLTDPFDLDDLHLLIMEQIFQRNLYKQKKRLPSKDISEQYEKSIKRLNDLKKGLSVRRSDRLKDKTTKKPIINIASLSMTLGTKEGLENMKQRIIDLKAEEASLDDNPDKVVD